MAPILMFRSVEREGAAVVVHDPFVQAAELAAAMDPDLLAITEWCVTEAERPRDAVWPEEVFA